MSAGPVPRAAVLVPAGALAAWAALLVAAHLWGARLMEDGVRLVLFTPPLLGGYRPEVPVALVGPAAVAVVLVAGVPVAVERARWPAVLGTATAAAAAWWLGLALVDGWSGLVEGLLWEADYAGPVPRAAADPLAFLSSYVRDLPGQPIALRGHPPGFVLLFAALQRAGLGGSGPAAAVVVAGGLAAVPAVLVTVRLVAGEFAARRAAPFVALAPCGLWVVTSTDGLSMGTAAWTVALVARAGVRSGWRADGLAVGAGVLAATVALQSYGLVLMALPAGAVALAQRRWRPVLVAGAVAAALLLLTAAAGFRWPAGLAATVHEYHTLGLERPYRYFLVANLAAWALALGPAIVVAVSRLRDRRLWFVVGGGAAAAGLAHLSGLSEGEVERIWLPFTIWVLPAGVALWSSRRAARAWLVVQVLTALAVTARVATLW